MNRLSTRLSIAMVAIAVFTVLIIFASQQIGFELDFRALPPEVQTRIKERHKRDRDVMAGQEDFAAGFGRRRNSQVRSMVIGTSFASLLAVGIAIVFARNISKPIEHVTSASAKVAQGDLSARILARPDYSSLEAKALTDNFNHMAIALETYENERRDMIASIAHDLRTPLTALQLRLTALQEELVPLSQAEISLLLSQTDLLERLISDLRTLSLADAGRLSLQKQQTNIAELMQDIALSYQQQADKQGVHIDVATRSNVTAQVDPARLKQILTNLLDNALRMSPVQGNIVLELESFENSFNIGVRDEGPGIPESLLPHVFDRYVKDKDSGGASGLGLAIVKTLVVLHGGTVRVDNINPGAKFKIQLPITL
jgi:signal transduction histidine kinase